MHASQAIAHTRNAMRSDEGLRQTFLRMRKQPPRDVPDVYASGAVTTGLTTGSPGAHNRKPQTILSTSLHAGLTVYFSKASRHPFG